MQENYVSVRNLSEQEAREIYSQLPKEKLIDMLIECNKTLDMVLEKKQYVPSISFKDYYDCSDWANCSNPHHGPLIYSNSGTWTSSSTISTANIDKIQ